MMAIELNHTIVYSRNKEVSATFLADVLGLRPPTAVGQFLAVELANGVTLDYDDSPVVTPQHYAFVSTSDEEFDGTLQRLVDAGIEIFDDPRRRQPGQVSHDDNGGRRFYFVDPDGHYLEVFTQPRSGPPTPMSTHARVATTTSGRDATKTS